MELPAVRPPRLSWSRRSKIFLRKLVTAPLPPPTSLAPPPPRSTTTTTKRGPMMATEPPSAPTSRATSLASSRTASPPASTTPAGSFAAAPPAAACRRQPHHGLFHRRGPPAKDAPQRISLPHTITERHGGRELWVTAPVLSAVLDKQGFRWRKKWKPRYVELNGRILSYYDLRSDGGGASPSQHAPKARKSVHLTADGLLATVDDLTFSLTPSIGEKPWIFRAPDVATKSRWCKALHDCIDILTWLQHYTVGDVLGVGGNGVVRKLIDNRNGATYAVKIVDASKFKNRAAAVAEVEILRNITNDIRHPNLVRIHKVYEEQEKIYMILDLCEGGELYDSIVRRGCYSERDAAGIMRQLLSALQSLHKHNILHLDLKPENILLSSKQADDAKIILTDFGLARMVNGKENPLEAGKTMAGTIGYIAPEVIAAHQYTEAADVFSAGVILFILLVGYPPFHGDSEVEILLKIARGDYQFHPDDWSHISMPAKELVSRMLEVRAPERITVEEALKHPWLAESPAPEDPRQLDQTVARMQQFNMVRKSENMGCYMATMVADADEADYLALVDVGTIETLIRQLSPSGSDKLVFEKALILARGLGLSPYVDVKSFIAFLDRNDDGFIDAQDFCDGVKAMRECHESFAGIIFQALRDMVSTDKAVLTREDFVKALDKLQCPDALREVFFKYLDEHPPRDESVNQVQFAELFQKFRFLGMLFIVKAKTNMVVMARGSTNELPQITEEIRDSLLLDSPESLLSGGSASS